MTADIICAVLGVLGVGILGAWVTLMLSKKNLRWAAILSPLTIVGSLGVGVAIGLKQMLIAQAEPTLLLVAATVPVAFCVGFFVSRRIEHLVDQTHVQEAAQQRFREVEAARRELITWLSHDLRTPLAGIRAMGEALEDGIVKDPSDYYHKIVREAQRTSEMVSDLMALATLSSGKQTMATEMCCLHDLLSDLLGQLEPFAQAAGITFVTDARVEVCEVVGDPALLTRAMQNLLANAVQYSHQGDVVKVKLLLDDGWVVLTVTDCCGGLSPAVKNRMFSPGWRANDARTPSAQGGSGLGLAIVKTVMEAHGGSVSVHDAPGGCTFELRVPLARATPQKLPNVM